MPQEIHVVRCYNCETFQCDIVKKVKKWTCKICNSPQSLQKVYYEGNPKDCRAFVQEFNMKRHNYKADLSATNQLNVDSKVETMEQPIEGKSKLETASKWSDYLSTSSYKLPSSQFEGTASKDVKDELGGAISLYNNKFNDENEDINDLLDAQI